MLQEVPEDEFIIDRFSDGVGNCCSVGHLNRLVTDDPTDYVISPEVRTEEFDWYELNDLCFHCYGHSITDVNDGEVEQYQQKTPKQRVIQFLTDINSHETQTNLRPNSLD